MRQEVINIYTFEELTPEDQARAIEDRRQANQEEPFFWSGEALEAIKLGLDAFGCSLGGYSIQWDNANLSDVPFSTPENAAELTGLRLRTWLINNADPGTLTTAKPYGKYEKRENKRYHEGKFDHWSYDRYSRILKVQSSCPFTGVCYDESFLYPIRDFIKKPTPGTTLADLMEDAINAVLRDVESDIEYRDTDEAIREELIANDYEFTENGEMA